MSGQGNLIEADVQDQNVINIQVRSNVFGIPLQSVWPFNKKAKIQDAISDESTQNLVSDEQPVQILSSFLD